MKTQYSQTGGKRDTPKERVRGGGREVERKRERGQVACLKFCREPVAMATGKVAGSGGRCFHGNRPQWPSDAAEREKEEEGERAREGGRGGRVENVCVSV